MAYYERHRILLRGEEEGKHSDAEEKRGNAEEKHGYGQKEKGINFYHPYYSRYTSLHYVQNVASGKMEAVVKIRSTAIGVGAVRRICDYIARDISQKDKEILSKESEGKDVMEEGDKVALENDRGDILSTQEERKKEIDGWSVDFKGKKSYVHQQWKEIKLKELKKEKNDLYAKAVIGGLSKNEEVQLKKITHAIDSKTIVIDNKKVSLEVRVPRDTTHMILSVGGQAKDETELEKATMAVRNFLSVHFKSTGHKYVFAAHTDTDNLHYHVIIKNSNDIDGKNLKFDRADLFALRHNFSMELEKFGIQRAATLRKDKAYQLNRIAKGIEWLHENKDWYTQALGKENGGYSFNALLYRNRILRNTDLLIKSANYLLSREGNSFHGNRLKEQVRVLKLFKEKMKKISIDNGFNEIKATVGKLGNDNHFLARKIELLAQFDNSKLHEAIYRRQANRQKAVGLFMEKHLKDIKASAALVNGGKEKALLAALEKNIASYKEKSANQRSINRRP